MAKAELKWDLAGGLEDELPFGSEKLARDYFKRVLADRQDVEVVYLCGADGVAREILLDRTNSLSIKRR